MAVISIDQDDDGGGCDPGQDWDDAYNGDDWYEPDPEDAESARWLAEEAAHFEEVHGGSGVCDCRPPLRNRVKWRVRVAGRRVGNAWYRIRCALKTGIDTGLYACEACGAVVAAGYEDRHAAFHARIAELERGGCGQ